ncbi:unnamed protein product [Porites lobata]|uniref:Uncharacterized protein n=1 Tax=Porites lobata TaxID=104759 RepID=A0ABN8NBS5_9CNID|nr:unnamed protein product [Porites lobata]
MNRKNQYYERNQYQYCNLHSPANLRSMEDTNCCQKTSGIHKGDARVMMNINCLTRSNNNNHNDNDDDNNNNNNNDFIILPQHILSQPSTHIKNAVLQCSHGFLSSLKLSDGLNDI